MTQLILPAGVAHKRAGKSAVESAVESIQHAQRQQQLEEMGPMRRLLTMLKNPSVPWPVKDDLKQVDASLSALGVLLQMIHEQIPEITDAMQTKHQTANPGEESLIAGRILARWNKTAYFVKGLIENESDESRVGE